MFDLRRLAPKPREEIERSSEAGRGVLERCNVCDGLMRFTLRIGDGIYFASSLHVNTFVLKVVIFLPLEFYGQVLGLVGPNPGQSDFMYTLTGGSRAELKQHLEVRLISFDIICLLYILYNEPKIAYN